MQHTIFELEPPPALCVCQCAEEACDHWWQMYVARARAVSMHLHVEHTWCFDGAVLRCALHEPVDDFKDTLLDLFSVYTVLIAYDDIAHQNSVQDARVAQTLAAVLEPAWTHMASPAHVGAPGIHTHYAFIGAALIRRAARATPDTTACDAAVADMSDEDGCTWIVGTTLSACTHDARHSTNPYRVLALLLLLWPRIKEYARPVAFATIPINADTPNQNMLTTSLRVLRTPVLLLEPCALEWFNEYRKVSLAEF